MDIKREVQKENALRNIVNVERAKLADILRPFMGLKIQKVDYTLVKKIKDFVNFDIGCNIEPLTAGGYASVQIIRLELSQYAIWLHVSLCYNGGSYDDNTHYCEYYKDCFGVADIRDRKLTNICENEPLPPLDADEQENQFNKCKDLKDNLEAEKELLYYRFREKI